MQQNHLLQNHSDIEENTYNIYFMYCFQVPTMLNCSICNAKYASVEEQARLSEWTLDKANLCYIETYPA